MTLPPDTSRHTMECAGSNLHYVVCHPKKTRTIVMLHGFSGNHRGLIPFVHELQDFKIIALDLPGFGDSTPMTEQPHTIEGYAACVATFLTRLALPEPPILLGHSFGTAIGACLASARPELIADRMILISPASVSPLKELSARKIAAKMSEVHYAFGNKAGTLGDRWLKSHLISRFASFSLITSSDKKIRKMIYNHHLDDLRFLRYKNVFLEAYRSLNQNDIMRFAPKIKQKVLLIAGAKDAMWPPKTQKSVHNALPSATLHLLPNVGHLTHFEAPQKIGKLIRQFLR